MKKQMTKGLTMLVLVAALAFAAAVVSANGQSRQARAEVPFDFIVNGATLTSGTYAVDSINAGGECLKVSNLRAKGTAASLTMPADGYSNHAKLVFHRYGQRYFLTEVWNGDGQGRRLFKSRQERAIEKEGAKIAALRGQSPRHSYETVEIASAVN